MRRIRVAFPQKHSLIQFSRQIKDLISRKNIVPTKLTLRRVVLNRTLVRSHLLIRSSAKHSIVTLINCKSSQ